MNALQQLLQSASNAAASNVSGPVDLIGMGLRKLGVPVPHNALMSSQWMAERGFTKPVPQNALTLAGETLGMTAPIAAAAKAPQIAAAMLQGGRNLTAPTMQGAMGQRGALMYHGGKFVKSPTADKQGVVIDGVPAVSFTPSKREARNYALHNQGDVYALEQGGAQIYKIGTDSSLDAAVKRGEWKAIRDAGFDGLEVVPGKEIAMFDYSQAAAKSKKAETFDYMSGKWRTN